MDTIFNGLSGWGKVGSPGAYRLADVLQVAEHWFAPLRQPDLAAPALSRLGKLQIREICIVQGGRSATDAYSGSSPESRRWIFASRKLPLADESSRPSTAVRTFAPMTGVQRKGSVASPNRAPPQSSPARPQMELSRGRGAGACTAEDCSDLDIARRVVAHCSAGGVDGGRDWCTTQDCRTRLRRLARVAAHSSVWADRSLAVRECSRR